MQVYAIDLLGFGASEKAKLVYSIELWRDLLLDFTTEFVDEPFVMVGNSVGSLVCLAANAASEPGRVRGTVLLNCAGATAHFQSRPQEPCRGVLQLSDHTCSTTTLLMHRTPCCCSGPFPTTHTWRYGLSGTKNALHLSPGY